MLDVALEGEDDIVEEADDKADDPVCWREVSNVTEVNSSALDGAPLTFGGFGDTVQDAEDDGGPNREDAEASTEEPECVKMNRMKGTR